MREAEPVTRQKAFLSGIVMSNGHIPVEKEARVSHIQN
jgi:hypothetical protein